MLDIQKKIGKIKILKEKPSEKEQIFTVEFLPRGFGYTLGNALRRLILGYSYGGAITGLKWEWADHEYFVPEWVRESILDVMLNLKNIRFKVDENTARDQWVTHKIKGPKKVYAKDLKWPSDLELVTPDVYLFEITDNISVEFKVRVEKDYRYFSLDYLKKREESQQDVEIWTLLIDNDFRLVEYVKYDIEEVVDDFIGTSKDRLILQIGAISPDVDLEQVISFAAHQLMEYASVFVFEENYIDKSVLVEHDEVEDKSMPTDNSKSEVKVTPIEVLALSERTRNSLLKNEILYVEDLEGKTKSELLSMKGIGKKALDEIVDSLGALGKTLKG